MSRKPTLAFAVIAVLALGACESDLTRVPTAEAVPGHALMADDDDAPEYWCKFYWVGLVPQDDSTFVLDTMYLAPDDPMGYNGYIYANPHPDNIIELFPHQKQVVNFRWQLDPPGSVYGQTYDYISWECSEEVEEQGIPVYPRLIVPGDWNPPIPFSLTTWRGQQVLAFTLFTNSWPYDFSGMQLQLVDLNGTPYSVVPVHITAAVSPPPCTDSTEITCNPGTSGTGSGDSEDGGDG